MSFSHRLCQLGLLAALLGVAPLWSQDATATLTCPASAAAGALVSCTVALTPNAGVTVTSMDFKIIVTPTGQSAPLDGTFGNADCCVNWVDSGSIKNNGRVFNASASFPPDNTDVIVDWVPLSGNITGFPNLGTFQWYMPSAATDPASYVVSFDTALANNGATVLNLTTNTATVSLATFLTISSPLTGAALPTATEGVAYSTTITASGGTTPYTWSVNAVSLPAGVSINATTGVISGTPGAAKQFNNIVVTVTDSENPVVQTSATYSLLVNPPVTAIAPATLPSGTVGSAYTSGNITVTGGTPPYMFTTSANLAGIGLALSPVAPLTATVAMITGTPTTGVANLSIPITVTDSNGAMGSGSVSLTITGIGITAPPSGALPNGTVNLIYAGPNGVTLTAAGGTGNITWSISSGALPAGLNLGSTGVNNTSGTITGTPTATTSVPGPTFTVTATDANNIPASVQYSITVYPAPVLTTAALPTATVGSAYNVAAANPITLAGGAPPVAWLITGLPAGLTFSATTGAITGTPSVGANTNIPYTVTFKVTDANGATSTVTSSLTVDAALVISTASPLPAATMGGPYTTTVTGSGGSTTGFSWSATNLPAGLTIASATGIISGTNVTGATANNVSITLTDSTGSSVSKTFTLPVNPALTITTANLPAATLNGPYSITLKSGGGTGTVTWGATGLPAGLGIVPATGIISGTPTTNTGTPFSVVITATDTNSATATATLSLTVNDALSVTGPATLPTATAGSAYTSGNSITIAGGTAPITAALSQLPANFGLTVSNTGVITGTPATATGQPFTLKVTATDANTASANQTFSLPVNPALTLTPSTLTVAIPGVAYSKTLTAGGGSGSGYTETATGLTNTGLSLSTAGVLSGTPLAAATGNHTVNVTVTDSISATKTFTYTLTIAPPLSINTPGTPPAGILTEAYAGFTATATGGTTPYTWSATGLPPGLTIGSSTGTITGTPTTVTGSPFTGTVKVTDANGTTATANYTFSISALPLQFITGLLPPGVVGAPYPFTSIRVQGGAGNYTWTITGLPAGLTTDGNGDISGTPTTATGSPFTVTVKVSDASNLSLTTTYSLVINNVLTVAAPGSLPGATLNAPYTPTTVTAGGGLAPYTWAATGLPTGMTINIANGVISGTPTTAAGSPYSVVVTVTDSTGKKATMNYTLAVASVLTITGPATLPTATLGGAYTSTTIMAAGGAPAYSWSATGLPAGLSIGSSTGAISGTPSGGTSGTVSVVVTVTDSAAATATMTYSLLVNPQPGSPTITSVSANTEGQSVIGPNTWVSVYGTNFTAPSFTDNWTNSIKNSATGALPTVLDNVSVSIGGQMAYIYFISATQINVLTPNIGFGTLMVTVTNVNGTSNAVMIVSQADSPGFFEWPNAAGLTPDDTSRQPVATHNDATFSYAAANGSFATPSVPAKPGETIILWGSGFGTTSPNNPFGVAVPVAGGPFASTGAVSVSLNNAPVTVVNSNAVLAPTLAGVFQVAITIPSTLADGTYPISVTVNGVTAPTLSLAVHQ